MVKKYRELQEAAAAAAAAASEPSSEQEVHSDDDSSSSEAVSAAQKKPTNTAAESEESHSESDDDSPPKPMIVDDSKLKKEKSKPNPKAPVVLLPSPTKTPPPPAAKRAQAEESTKKKVKKQKLEDPISEEGEAEEGKKSVPFQRLWSDEDEIAVLQGLVDYKVEKGTDPMSNTLDFYDFVKESLQCRVDRRQMVDKIRKLRKRYENYYKKKSLTPHEEKAGEVSKLIWGDIILKAAPVDDIVDNHTTAKSKRKTRTKEVSKAAAERTMEVSKAAAETGTMEVDNEEEDFGVTDTAMNPFKFIGKTCVTMGLDENLVKLGLGLCAEESKTEIEEKWKQIYLEESALFARKLELASEESKLVTEALKSRD